MFVSTGTPSMARDFQEQLGLDSAIWTDPKRQTYGLLGFKRSIVSTLLNPRTLLHGVRTFRAGFRQGKTLGDPWQQGGVVVVRGGKAVYAYASAEAGDHPPTEEVVRHAIRAGG